MDSLPGQTQAAYRSEMYRALSDLRLLRLALHLEETLERYEDYLRSSLLDVPVRAKLAVLFEQGPYHQRLRQASEALAKWIDADPPPNDTQSVLQTLLDCERIARDFYLRQLDQVSDPVLVDIFQGMAAEETGHMEAVRQAMELAQRLALQRRVAPPRQDG